MVSVGLSLLLAYKVGSYYGLEECDSVLTLLTPLAILNAESFPKRCMNDGKSNHFFSKGFSRNFVFLHWSVMGMLLVFCFTCNLRAMILKPQMETTKDTTKDLIISGTTPIVVKGFNQENLLKNSVNEWQQKAFESKFSQEDSADTEYNLKNLVQKEGTHAVIANPEEIAYAVKNDPYYKDQNKPVFHISQESLESYYVGWVTGKISPWKKTVDDHIGLILQVSKIYVNIYNFIMSIGRLASLRKLSEFSSVDRRTDMKKGLKN